MRRAGGMASSLMAATLLTEDQITQALATIPEWKREGSEIMRTYSFPSYLGGVEFVSRVATQAEAANHHPDIHVGWRKVTLRLSTHSAKGLTEKDFDLARKADATK